MLILSASAEQKDVLEAVKAGATGYLLKSASRETFLDAVRDTAAGQGGVHPRPRRAGAGGVPPDGLGGGAGVATSSALGLTERETEVLRLVATGMSYKQIAAHLFISHRTVQNHVQNTLGKLQLHNRVELARFAIAKGLDTPPPPDVVAGLPGGRALPASRPRRAQPPAWRCQAVASRRACSTRASMPSGERRISKFASPAQSASASMHVGLLAPQLGQPLAHLVAERPLPAASRWTGGPKYRSLRSSSRASSVGASGWSSTRRSASTPPAVVAGARGDDVQGGGLAAAAVAAGAVAGQQGVHQPRRHRQVGAAEPGVLHLVDDLVADQDVALDGVAAAGVASLQAAGPRVALRAGEGHLAGGGDDAELPGGAALVGAR